MRSRLASAGLSDIAEKLEAAVRLELEDGVRLADKLNRPSVGVTFNLCHWLKVEAGKSRKQKRTVKQLHADCCATISVRTRDNQGEKVSAACVAGRA